MARSHRLLLSVNSSDVVVAAAPPPEAAAMESDFVVILAALLCALICVVGLIAVARCTWLRRRPAAGVHSTAANKGLKKRVVESLPKVNYSSGAGAGAGARFRSPECAICLGEFVEGEEMRLLPQCGHAFHVACIDTWLGSHSSCPSCRQVLVAGMCNKCGRFPAAGEEGKTTSDLKVDHCHSTHFLP